MRRTFFILIAAIASYLCPSAAQNTTPFPYPALPLYINSEQAQMEYLVEHFWDDCDLGSIATRYTYNTLSDAFARWGQLLGVFTGYGPTHPLAERAITRLLDRAAKTDKECYWFFLEWLENLFYTPHSPLRCDGHFVVVCRHATSPTSSPLDSTETSRYASLLRLASRNNPTDTATDFAYTLANGRQSRLHAIDSELLLLFFYNPDCNDCRRVKRLLEASATIQRLHDQRRLTILALYPDAEVDVWRNHLHENPSWWINSYDNGSQILRHQLYDLKASPTLYLLDKDKRVILKDPDAEQLLWLLENNF